MEPTRKSAKEKLMLNPAPAIFPRDTATLSANVFAADKTSGDVKIPFKLFPIPTICDSIDVNTVASPNPSQNPDMKRFFNSLNLSIMP